MNLPPRVWVIAERLYIHAHGTDEFVQLLGEHGLQYVGEAYSDFKRIPTRYTFMSEEDYSFARYMQSVPSYKYLSILEHVVFDPEVVGTSQDNWNYYGEFIKHWYPALLDLLKLAAIRIDEQRAKLELPEEAGAERQDDLLPYPFYDPFLDYLRKEVNESYKADLYLCVMFLTRKIIEVLFIRVAEVVFPKIVNGNYSEENHELWFDRSRNSHRGLDQLIAGIRAQAAKFDEDKRLVEEFCSLVKPLKDETNAVVHVDYKMPDAQYVRQWRIPHVVNMGRRLFRKYCNP